MSNTPSWMRDLRGRIDPVYQGRWRAKQLRRHTRARLHRATTRHPAYVGQLGQLREPGRRKLGIGAPLRERRAGRLSMRLSCAIAGLTEGLRNLSGQSLGIWQGAVVDMAKAIEARGERIGHQSGPCATCDHTRVVR